MPRIGVFPTSRCEASGTSPFRPTGRGTVHDCPYALLGESWSPASSWPCWPSRRRTASAWRSRTPRRPRVPGSPRASRGRPWTRRPPAPHPRRPPRPPPARRPTPTSTPSATPVEPPVETPTAADRRAPTRGQGRAGPRAAEPALPAGLAARGDDRRLRRDHEGGRAGLPGQAAPEGHRRARPQQLAAAEGDDEDALARRDVQRLPSRPGDPRGRRRRRRGARPPGPAQADLLDLRRRHRHLRRRHGRGGRAASRTSARSRSPARSTSAPSTGCTP